MKLMYKQYRDDLGNVYYIDTSENPFSYFLITFNWIIKRKVYVSKKLVIEELDEKKKRARLIAFYISTPLGIILAEYTKLSNSILYNLNFTQALSTFILVYLFLMIAFIMFN